ncbi:hypothetical protein HDU67_007054 [Dinochytrium kinnereticum]|nr:hypothetical protein HDU67_007054 [Dinochytrium kinnereticum]
MPVRYMQMAADPAAVEFSERHAGRVITFNRPLLEDGMMDDIYGKIEEWDKDPATNVIIMKSGNRAGSVFCGGLDMADIKTPDGLSPDWSNLLKKRLTKLYRLSHRLATLDTPLICVMDGLTPGLASHHIPADRIDALVERLCGLKNSDIRFADVVTEELSDAAPSVEEWSSWSLGGELLDSINRCFGKRTVGDIIKALEKENSLWSTETLAFLSKRSPTFLEYTVQALRKGKDMDLSTSMKMEAAATLELMKYPDFAMSLVREGNLKPEWSPSLEEVVGRTAKQAKNAVAVFFPDLSVFRGFTHEGGDGSEVEILSSDRTYSQYVHRSVTGLATEEDVRKVVTGEAAGLGDFALTHDEVINFFHEIWGSFLHPITLAPLSTPPSQTPPRTDTDEAEPVILEEEDGRENRKRPRPADMRGAVTKASQQPEIRDFFPGKFMQPQLDDPSVQASRLGRGRKRETWGLRQRVVNVVLRRCDVDANGFLSWRDQSESR